MYDIATAVVLFAALTALVSLWSPLLCRLTELAARYILPMQFGMSDQADPGKHGAESGVRQSI